MAKRKSSFISFEEWKKEINEVKKELSDIANDDEKWSLFVQQVKQHKIPMNESYTRSVLKGDKAGDIKRLCDTPGFRYFHNQLFATIYRTQLKPPICNRCSYKSSNKTKIDGVRVAKCGWDYEGESAEKTPELPWLDRKKNLCRHFYNDPTDT